MLELVSWWRGCGLSPRPWLILGKGPSFARRHEFDLSAYHLLALNDAARELDVTVAHAIDIDVVARCGTDLARRCRWLLMPRRPHVNCRAGGKLLEEYFGDLPVLRHLADEGRLVWYNLSSSRPVGDSPVIRPRYFSAEAVLDVLGTLGVRQVRSLGVDGGTGYSPEFADLAGTTHLANGHESFDVQFARIDEIVARHRLDYAPLVEPVRVFVGTDESQHVAARVLEHSIRRHTTRAVQFHALNGLPIPTPKHRANRPRTGFSFYRFAIPKLCGYHGRALYLDADMQVVADLDELWRIPFGDQKVLCTNQPTPPAAWKDLSWFHPGRQMSVMLLDCSRLDWDVEAIVRGLDEGRYDYRQLMFDLCVVRPDEIADRIPPEWNCLEWHEPTRTKLLHYTVVPTQPWKNDRNPLRHVWLEGFREALAAGALEPADVLRGIRGGHLDPSLAAELPAGELRADARHSRRWRAPHWRRLLESRYLSWARPPLRAVRDALRR
jgi:hypothetical protein